MIIYSKDAKSCYNHITYSIVSLVIQRLGILVKLLKYMFSIIQEMMHYIRTAFGYSELLMYSKEEEKSN